MESNGELIKVERSSHYKRHLIIIAVLVLSFSLSFMVRTIPAQYGFELHEFDPFFNYRATEFVVENGLPAYLEWNDDLSWHPYGRDVSATSQVMLHTTAATLYQIFGAGSSLYDFTIWFPVVMGSLTTVVIFALVRTISNTTAGLLASLFFAISPIIIVRGSIGWFKSEPLGLFFGLLAVYLLLSGIKSDKGKASIGKIVGGGILLALGLAAWGGVQFFILPIGIFFIALPFLRKDNKFIVWTSVVFTSVFLLTTMSFERTGIAFFSSLNGFFLIGCTIFLVVCTIIKGIGNKAQLRNGFALLGGAIIAGIAMVSSGMINLPSFRYLNAANPFLITTDMLTDSVSEHATTTIDLSFFFFSILMVFAGIGGWFLFQKKVSRSLNIQSEMAAFALIIGFLGIYFSSAFVRLEVLGGISVIVLSSIGTSILISKILQNNHKPRNTLSKISFLAVITILLTVPIFYPEHNWGNDNMHRPISILHSATSFDISTNDWPAAMLWLKENTPEDAVVVSWWDYGYWISTLSERKTVADNATLLDWQIKKIASVFLSTPNNAWKILASDAKTDVSTNFTSFPIADSSATNLEERKLELFAKWRMTDENGNGVVNGEEPDSWMKGVEKECVTTDWLCTKSQTNPGKSNQYNTLFDYWESEVFAIEPVLTGLDADYIVVNLAVRKLSDENEFPMYVLDQDGGDETKAFWFMKIADLRVRDYYNPGADSYTDKFWNETLLGKLIPFTVITYVDPNNPELQSRTWKQDYMPIYIRDVKFTIDEKNPFQLVYVPPSFENDESGNLAGPLIYKINKEYNPNQ